MKVYSIGRETSCDIVIHDSTDVISRRHAILNVAPSGKMTITDQSHNGTYVNGIRIASGVPVPVTRKDSISFAHVARLDWNTVPRPASPLRYALIAMLAIVVVAGAVWGGTAAFSDRDGGASTPAAPDSTRIRTEQQIRQAAEDSMKRVQARKDSADRAARAKARKAAARKDERAAAKNAQGDKKNKPADAKNAQGNKKDKPADEAQKARRIR